MRFRAGAILCRLTLVAAVCLAAVNLLALAIRFPLFAAVPLGVVAWKKLNRWQVSDAYGNARPSGYADLWQNGMLDADDGIFMGTCGHIEPPSKAEGVAALFSRKPAPLACRLFLAAFFGRGWGDGITIRVRDAIHTGIFASTGAGKNVSILIPNLLSYRGSVVVLDPQGSLFSASADFRSRRFLNRVVRLDSSEICGKGGGGLNPLDFLDPESPGLLEDCRLIADLLVFKKESVPDPHWDDRAVDVIQTFIYFVAKYEIDPARRNLLAVRSIINSRDVYMASMNILRKMSDPVAKELGDSLTWLASDELNSVISVVSRHIGWMASPVVADSLRRSTFDPMDLKKGRLSVYILEHPQRLEMMAPHLRVILGTIIRVITRGKASEENPVLFVIDETAALSRMQILENAVTQLRGYGLRLILTFQSSGQLQKVYRENAQTIAGNLGTQLYFRTLDYESTEHLSKLIGDCTITLRSVNDTSGHSHPTGQSAQPQPGNASSSVSVTTSETGRRWAKSEEIRTFPRDFGILTHSNMNVITPRLIRHFDSPLFRHDGTGESRGLGLAGAVMATGMMVLSLLLSAVVASLPDPPPLNRPAVAVPAVRQAPPPPFADGRSRPPGDAFRRPTVRPRRRPHTHARAVTPRAGWAGQAGGF